MFNKRPEGEVGQIPPPHMYYLEASTTLRVASRLPNSPPMQEILYNGLIVFLTVSILLDESTPTTLYIKLMTKQAISSDLVPALTPACRAIQ